MFATGLLILIVGQVPLVTYDEAIAIAQREQRPMLVYVESEYCPPCKQMWQQTIEPMAADLRAVSVVKVNRDRDLDRANALQVKSTPTLIGFRYTNGKWTRYKLEGRQSIDRVREMLRKMRE